MVQMMEPTLDCGSHSSTEPLSSKPAYEKVLSANYMCHAELVTTAMGWLDDRWKHYGAESQAFLDLGCGDGRYLVSKMQQAGLVSRLRSYTGVDESKEAIKDAQANLAGAVSGYCELHFQESDILSYLQAAAAPQDAVFSCYALHHVPSLEEKSEVLRELARLLNPGGALLLADTFLAPGETREQYGERMKEAMNTKWDALTASEKEAVTGHMATCDWPETLEDYRSIAQAAGFARVACLWDSGPEQNIKLVSFER